MDSTTKNVLARASRGRPIEDFPNSLMTSLPRRAIGLWDVNARKRINKIDTAKRVLKLITPLLEDEITHLKTAITSKRIRGENPLKKVPPTERGSSTFGRYHEHPQAWTIQQEKLHGGDKYPYTWWFFLTQEKPETRYTNPHFRWWEDIYDSKTITSEPTWWETFSPASFKHWREPLETGTFTPSAIHEKSIARHSYYQPRHLWGLYQCPIWDYSSSCGPSDPVEY